ncbi:uncharacterized protein LOC122382046 [Amphibalanus amphitrite]|uniref:uncharacterized protein LOC122382046 n=1 Tax=Amphibalanus amphitrite TaxID=1232801 RepID=UPI001C906C32|nr:uncharacterized protein LOC122382046 [Amphibalanus amphitrite]
MSLDSKRKSIQIQCSLIQHECTRLSENISECVKNVLSISKTAGRAELQQLSQLNTELSGHVAGAADQVDLLQQRLEQLMEQMSEALPQPAGDTGSVASAAGRRESSVSTCSSPRPSLSQGRRADRNVALRHLRREPELETRPDPELNPEPDPGPGPEPEPRAGPEPCLESDPETDSETDSEPEPEPERRSGRERLDYSRGSSPPPESSASSRALSNADVSHGLPSREINLKVMHDVSLAHHDLLEDCDLLYLNLREDQPSLETLCSDLEALSSAPRCILAAPPRAGDLVFARWNGVWYRGRVSAAPAAGTVQVQFVDYGNYDTVPLSECRRLPERLTRMPVCAVACVPAGAAAAPDGPRRQLQALLIEALLAPDAPVRALFQRPAGGGPLRAQLAVTVTVGAEPRLVDVGRTLSNVMTVSPEDAQQQVETKHLALERLMVPFVSPRGRSGAGESRVLDWLSTGDGNEAGARNGTEREAEPPPQRTTNGRVAADRPADQLTDAGGGEPTAAARRTLSPVKASPQTFVDPPKYRGLGVSWHSRPIYRAPRELCARNPHRDVIIVRAQSPDNFYISFESQDKFDEFQQQMQTAYARLPVHPRQGLHPDLLCAGSFWAARFSDDEWCRAVIVGQLPPEGGDGLPRYRVHAVDFGDEDEVSPDQLRPMLEQFASQPVFLVRAKCSGVAPLADESDYSAEARERFVDLVDVININAHTVSSETTEECLAVVLYRLEDCDVVPVTRTMAEEGLVEHWEVQEDVGAAATRPAPLEVLPSAGDAAAEPFTVPPLPPLASSDDEWRPRAPGEPLRLPPAGAVVYVKVTAVISPELFYVVMPFGVRAAQRVNEDFMGEVRRLAEAESVEMLAAAMRRFYGSRPAEGSQPTPPVGAPVAVRWQGGWHRGTVLVADEDHAEVFLTDWGHSEPVPREDLRELVRRFQQLPAQAVACSLGSASTPPPRRWPPAAVERLVALAQHGLLLAHVLAAPLAGGASSAQSRLLVDLYHATGLDDGVWASRFVCGQ